jgi:hypothetical protein
MSEYMHFVPFTGKVIWTNILSFWYDIMNVAFGFGNNNCHIQVLSLFFVFYGVAFLLSALFILGE